ncbi:hypothetical protein OUZ56_032020 [Daphnia magna]|uniref:Uncharacterized protein n=1 Tax=Daphnia magna TaxID=35525 RepID=A0ABQ9ZWP3_9CRUS|nr:hypothetical protein OUZ56_032020 [Daphnia magna]
MRQIAKLRNALGQSIVVPLYIVELQLTESREVSLETIGLLSKLVVLCYPKSNDTLESGDVIRESIATPVEL